MTRHSRFTYLDVGGSPVLLDEDPQQELSLLARLERGGDDAVAALGQPQPLAHLAQVDERVGSVHLKTLIQDRDTLYMVNSLGVPTTSQVPRRLIMIH